MFRYSRATSPNAATSPAPSSSTRWPRLFDDGGAAESAQGLIAGFGPGITAEAAVGRWTNDDLRPSVEAGLGELELTAGVALSG